MFAIASIAESVPVNDRQLDTFSCVTCGQSQTGGRPVLRSDADRRPFDLHRCTHCGLVQQSPRYSPKEIAALYGDDYYVFAEEDSCRWARAVQQYVVHLLPWETESYRRLLDVGCASGHLAALASRRGWNTVGLDLSARAVSEASVRFGLDVRGGSLARHSATLPPFDLIFLGDVLEHDPAPTALLREVGHLLTPGGVVCIDTPNWASPWRRWGGRHWLGLNRYHINFFDAEVLSRLLESVGLGDVRTGSCTHYRYESWAHRPEPQVLIQKLPGPLAWRVNRLLERRSEAKPWALLRKRPPSNLDEALAMLDGPAGRVVPAGASRLTGDNLIATARRC